MPSPDSLALTDKPDLNESTWYTKPPMLEKYDAQLAKYWLDKDVRRNNTVMRTILLSTFGAILLLAAFSSCSTTVRTDSGHAVTTGVHAN